ncbi:transposase, partial [Sinorhizobium medicae]|uniref:transposase n=1 Tax=Sinorhizobium medicae TaxID=110321 RepID=UPI00311FD4EF
SVGSKLCEATVEYSGTVSARQCESHLDCRRASAGISEQTYYHWKGAGKPGEQKAGNSTKSLPVGDELADLVQLEEENQRLRKRLAEKLRAENAELRKRLGLD